ncbi:hypothetical protein [uncultured Sphaerochaeta sp.]|uniref:hypothetical protein n=1 Tax=uncultured Sphaerochaeta sp. TaxID=886478 RepID=UPI0029CA93F8|nr:hypothetical protein [uncultured Sphaerochaeta sp.]
MITLSTKQEILAPSSEKIFCNVLKIIGTGFVFRFIDNNEQAVISGEEFLPKGFDYTPADPQADDATSNIKIEDIDRQIIQALQETLDPVTVSVGLIQFDVPDTYLENPVEFMLDSVSAPGDGSVILELAKKGLLGYTASGTAYDATNFPGLFG